MAGTAVVKKRGSTLARPALLPDDARSGGLMIFAPQGWGKSRLLGRGIVHQKAMRGVGVVVIEAVGGTIHNALDKALYLPEGLQRRFIDRLRYCNMAGERGEDGKRYAPAFPMRRPQSSDESLFVTAQRVV